MAEMEDGAEPADVFGNPTVVDGPAGSPETVLAVPRGRRSLGLAGQNIFLDIQSKEHDIVTPKAPVSTPVTHTCEMM